MANWLRLFRRRHATPPLELPGPISPEDKAEMLLRSKLTGKQRRTFLLGYFDVTGSRGGRYRIGTKNTVLNITGRGRPGVRFCVASAGRYPPRCDVWLFQKILIESDEDAFLRSAIRSYYTPWSYR